MKKASSFFKFILHRSSEGKDSHKQPSSAWYIDILRKSFDLNKVFFLVFSDENNFATTLMNHIKSEEFKANKIFIKFYIIEEDFATSLALMSRCHHHVAAASAFSFWGMCSLNISL